MSLLEELRHALKDGLTNDVVHFKLAIWSEQEQAGLAYSAEHKEMWLLLLKEPRAPTITKDDYLDYAKAISNKLDCFVAPNQQAGSPTLWAGKTRGPVHAYKLKVLISPWSHTLNWEDAAS